MNMQRFLISVAVMAATVMQVLDTTIVNVALPHMQGQLSATPDQISWVLTSYMVSSGIFMPLTGYFTHRFGQKKFLFMSIVGFVIASVLCGLSTNLNEIVLFRLLQGVSGAALVPLSQSVMVATFPPQERGKAMAIWGIGVMLGPILGPTVGGLVTEHLNWRWVFYINLPVGLLNLALVARSIQETPRREAGTDWLGALLMIIGIGSLQTLLDRGNQEGWWSSDLILLLTMTAVVGLALFGTIAIQPLLMERLLNYPVETTGLVMAPRGFGAAFGMLVIARLAGRVDARWIIGTGMSIAAVATWMMSWYNLDISPGWLIWPGVLQGIGMGTIFVTLSTLAYATLPASDTDAGAGLFNLARSVGSSIGVSVAATWYTRFGQADWNRLGGHINPFNPALNQWLQDQGMTLQDPAAAGLLAHELSRQASMIAFTQVFGMIALSFVLMAPLLFLLKPKSKG